MNAAIVKRSFRDGAWILALVFVAVVGFEMLYVVAIDNVAEDLLQLWRRIPIIQKMLEMLAGVNIDEDVSITSLMSLGMVHPFLLAACWALLITSGTRGTVRELDAGTADLLLTLPVSRATVYASVSILPLVSCVLLGVAAWIGLLVGGRLFGPEEPLNAYRVFIAAVNFCALLLAVAGGTLCVAAISSRRGVAVAVILATLLVSFLVNFLAVFVPVIERFSFLGFLHYYRPVDCARTGEWPVSDIVILLCGAIALWLVGMWRFARRDIPAS